MIWVWRSLIGQPGHYERRLHEFEKLLGDRIASGAGRGKVAASTKRDMCIIAIVVAAMCEFTSSASRDDRLRVLAFKASVDKMMFNETSRAVVKPYILTSLLYMRFCRRKATADLDIMRTFPWEKAATVLTSYERESIFGDIGSMVEDMLKPLEWADSVLAAAGRSILFWDCFRPYLCYDEDKKTYSVGGVVVLRPREAFF